MPKGFFSQGVMVLTDGAVKGADIAAALVPFGVARHIERDADVRPYFTGYETWLIPYRPEVNGAIAVDLVDLPWPDDMGDPKSPDEARQMLFAAWSMGYLGPFTFPGNLERATRWAEEVYDRSMAAEAARGHRGLIRVRSSYVFGAQDDAPILPAEYDPVAELSKVTEVAAALLNVEGAVAYFNPGGEVLCSLGELTDVLDHCRTHNLPPLPAWSVERVALLSDAPGWAAADTVGMEQLDVADQEAIFPADGGPDAGAMAGWLRDVSLYLLQNGPVVEPGHTTDGPGGTWRAHQPEQSALAAPRPTLRWYRDADADPPTPYQRPPLPGREG
jgi:hypothetical protein